MKKPLSTAAILRRGVVFSNNAYRMLTESKVSIAYLAQCVGVDVKTIRRIITAYKTKAPYLPCDRTVAKFAHIAEVSETDFVNEYVRYIKPAK